MFATSTLRMEQIKPTDFSVDHRAQRAIVEPHRDNLTSRFDPRKVGAVIVSERANGDKYVLDGQHRLTAAANSGYNGTIPAVIHSGLTIDEEADIFLALNESKLVHPIDKFHARVTAGRATSVTVNNIVKSLGFAVETTGLSPKSIAAVATLERIYTVHGGDTLTATLVAVDEAWEDLPVNARSARFLEAVGDVLGSVEGAKLQRLVAKLKTTSAGNIIADADFLADLHKRSKKAVTVDVLIALYNKGLKKDQQISVPE